jgi:hypothetical protein
LLARLGNENAGYGLYSYAIVVSDSIRSSAFLAEIFKSTPAIEDTGTQPSQLNILYVPMRTEKTKDFSAIVKSPDVDAAALGATYSKSFYDYKLARVILDHVCSAPPDSMRDLCRGDLSRGPFIFTYATPASNLANVPPPYLFVDLSDIHEKAFGELLSAFREQVKREDVSDGARINTLRLTILNIVLTASDWVVPVQKAIADVVHSTIADSPNMNSTTK